jgi:hypothetical protein
MMLDEAGRKSMACVGYRRPTALERRQQILQEQIEAMINSEFSALNPYFRAAIASQIADPTPFGIGITSQDTTLAQWDGRPVTDDDREAQRAVDQRPVRIYPLAAQPGPRLMAGDRRRQWAPGVGFDEQDAVERTGQRIVDDAAVAKGLIIERARQAKLRAEALLDDLKNARLAPDMIERLKDAIRVTERDAIARRAMGRGGSTDPF